MEKEEILRRAESKKALVGEMEKVKVDKSNWIALIVTAFAAVTFIITFGILGNFTALLATAFLCYLWAGVFYFCQYFVAKRPWPVLIGAVLHSLAAITMLVLFILRCTGVL